MLHAMRGSTIVSAVLIVVVGVDLGTYASVSFLFPLLARRTCLLPVAVLSMKGNSREMLLFQRKRGGEEGRRKLFTRIATLDVQTHRFAMACRRCAVGTGRGGWWLKCCLHVKKYENDQSYILSSLRPPISISFPLKFTLLPRIHPYCHGGRVQCSGRAKVRR